MKFLEELKDPNLQDNQGKRRWNEEAVDPQHLLHTDRPL